MEFKISNIPKVFRSKYKIHTSGVVSVSGSTTTVGTTPSGNSWVEFVTNSILSLPNLGKENTLYIVKDEETGEEEIYTFDTSLVSYKKLTNNYNNINTINGGLA